MDTINNLVISDRSSSNVDVQPISVSNLTYQFADGHKLFNNLNFTFSGLCGLVGNNGVGKSVLASILAGRVEPTSGSVSSANIYYLPQSIDSACQSKIIPNAEIEDTIKGNSVAHILGVEERLAAIKRVDSGVATVEDFDLLDGAWDIEAKVCNLLTEFGLEGVPLDQSVDELSGGEIATLYLIQAFMSGANVLILDEPTNHMDVSHKTIFINMLKSFKSNNGTVILISHDREVLDNVDEIVELSPLGLRKYGGGYTLYEEMKSEERELLENKIRHEGAKLKREKVQLTEKLDRASRRVREGAKKAAKGGLPKILLSGRKQISERTMGRLSKEWTGKLEKVEAGHKELHGSVNHYRTYLTLPPVDISTNKEVFRLDEVVLPYGDTQKLNYLALGQDRIAITGDNGSGKTTLLKVLTGEMPLTAGVAKIYVPYSIVGQMSVSSDLTVLEFIQDRSLYKEHEIRTALANINLLRERVMLPFNLLSGGERLRVQILAELMSENVPQLLILDEPTNHLDLHSIRSLEEMLNGYTGTLLVVSHDKYFLENLGIDTYIKLKC